MTPFEKKHQQWLAEAIAKLHADAERARNAPPPAPPCDESLKPPLHIVDGVTTSRGLYWVKHVPGSRHPWRIISPTGRVMGWRATREIAVAAMRRFVGAP